MNTLFGSVPLVDSRWNTHRSQAPFPQQGRRRAAGSQVRLQRCSLRQTSASPGPGAELFLSVPPTSVRPAQKSSSSNPPATGPQQSRRVHRRGRPRDTTVSVASWESPSAPHQLLLSLSVHVLTPPCRLTGFETRFSLSFCLLALRL